MQRIRLLLVDDHTILRKSLRGVIDRQNDMTVVGEAKDGVEAVKRAQELAPDIILMDIEMPRLDGIGAARLIAEHKPEMDVIILSIYLGEEYLFEAIRVGVRGYVLKGAEPEELLELIRAVHRGETRIDPTIASKALVNLCRQAEGSQGGTMRLTKREGDILSFVVKGATNREIAQELSLSERTVRNRLSAVFRKLGVRNRTEAAFYAIQEGLVTSV